MNIVQLWITSLYTLLKLILSEYTVEVLVGREDDVDDGKDTAALTAEAIFS
jgi:hypothetical protein